MGQSQLNLVIELDSYIIYLLKQKQFGVDMYNSLMYNLPRVCSSNICISAGGQQSHLLNSVAASTNSITMTTSDSPHHPTVSYTSSQVTEPDMGYEISYGDAHFMGKQRYVENGASYASDDTNTSPQHSSESLPPNKVFNVTYNKYGALLIALVM